MRLPRLRVRWDSTGIFWQGFRWGFSEWYFYDLGIMAVDYYLNTRTVAVYFWKISLTIYFRGRKP